MKNREYFKEQFLKCLLLKSQQHKAVLIRYPSGKTQLLDILESIKPILKIFKRVCHFGVFEDQNLNNFSIIGSEIVEKNNVIYICLSKDIAYLYLRNWEKIKSDSCDLNANYYLLKDEGME